MWTAHQTRSTSSIDRATSVRLTPRGVPAWRGRVSTGRAVMRYPARAAQNQPLGLRKRGARDQRKPDDDLAPHQLHGAGVDRRHAEQEPRHAVERPRHELAPLSVVLVAPAGDDHIVVGRERQHLEKDARVPLAIGGVQEDELPGRLGIQVLEGLVDAAVARVVNRPHARQPPGRLVDDGGGAIGRAIVADQDLVLERRAREQGVGIVEHTRDRGFLVVGRETDRDAGQPLVHPSCTGRPCWRIDCVAASMTCTTLSPASPSVIGRRRPAMHSRKCAISSCSASVPSMCGAHMSPVR